MTWRTHWEELRRGPTHRAFVLAEEAKNTIAANVHRHRTRLGISQKALADAVGTKQPNISVIELADANPTVETLGKLAAALGVSITELVTPPDEADPRRALRESA